MAKKQKSETQMVGGSVTMEAVLPEHFPLDNINTGLYDSAFRDREVQTIRLLQEIRDLLKAKQ